MWNKILLHCLSNNGYEPKKDSYKHKSCLKDMLSLSREIIVTTIRHGPFPSIIMDYAAYWGNRSEWFEFVFAIFLSVCVDVQKLDIHIKQRMKIDT